MEKFLDSLTQYTERFLTWRKRRKHIQKEKSKKKSTVLQWVEAFFWSAGVVLLINQYLLQAFVIPSGSMIPTLDIGDRIFVNKLVYGPEVLPNLGKLPGLRSPSRGDLIIYESPEYESKGPVFDILKRMIFMMSFSLVDIDTEYREFFREQGIKEKGWFPRVQFLIKRASGFEGDQVRFWNKKTYIRPKGAMDWIEEENLTSGLGVPYGVDSGVLHSINRWFMESTYEEYSRYLNQNPGNKELGRYTAWVHQGTYVPKGYLMTLGDNRNNSHDGRFFGPVRLNKILGTPALRFWPLRRFGGME